MSGYEVGRGVTGDIILSLNSHTVEGTQNNTKSDFTHVMRPPLVLTAEPWTCSLDCMTFSSKIVNYNSSFDESGPSGGWGIPEDLGPSSPKKPKKEDPSPMAVQAQYDLLAVDGDGKWRKQTPAPNQGRHLNIKFKNPDDKKQVAEDIKAALTTKVEPVRRPPLPNPESDFTELQWCSFREDQITPLALPTRLEPLLNRMSIPSFFTYLGAQGQTHAGISQLVSLKVSQMGRVAYYSPDNLGFIIKGNNPERLARMLKVFGVTGVEYLVVRNDWTSPNLINLNKTDALDPYNLTGPYDWWTQGGENEFLSYDRSGREHVRIHFERGQQHYTMFQTYEDLRACTSTEEILRLLLPAEVEWGPDPDQPGLWRLIGSHNKTTIDYYSMPCDIIPRVLGTHPFQDPWRVYNNRINMWVHVEIEADGFWTFQADFTPCRVMPLTDIVHVGHDTDTDSVMFSMGYSGHVQGFTIKFPRDSPFYDNAGLSIGQVTDESFRPPPGVHVPLVFPANTPLRTDRAPVPYLLKGMQPLGPKALLALKRKTCKPVPPRGYHLNVSAIRNIPVEEWYSSDNKEAAYAFHDVVGDLPFPASYQTPEALIAALYTSINHAIQGDPYNSQHGCTAQDLLSVTYDKSTCRYMFECGPKGGRIELTMQRNLALLFGFDRPDEHTTIRFAAVPKHGAVCEPSTEDRVWARVGHALTLIRNTHGDQVLPVAVESTFPVTSSLGTENMYIRTDIIGDGASIHDGRRGNVLAVVPVDWSHDKASVHQPLTQVGIPMKSHTISSINIKIQDSHGDNIRFMSHDNLPVTVTLRFSRVRR